MNTNVLNTIILFITFVLVVSCRQTANKQLPIINPSDVNPNLVDKSVQNKSENHTVTDFNLINQNGERITQVDYENKIYVTDFIFTRCQGICPIMTNNMGVLQKEFLKKKEQREKFRRKKERQKKKRREKTSARHRLRPLTEPIKPIKRILNIWNNIFNKQNKTFKNKWRPIQQPSLISWKWGSGLPIG